MEKIPEKWMFRAGKIINVAICNRWNDGL